VRTLLEAGNIPAQRVGRQWVIDAADVARYQPVSAGRPLSERSAWLLMMHAPNMIIHEPVDFGVLPVRLEPSPIERHRLNQRLNRLKESSDPIVLIRSLLARRAENVELSCSPADLAELRKDARIRFSGVSHPESGLLPDSEVEAYVSRKDYNSLLRDWLLVETAHGQRPNVVFHVADEIPDELPLLTVAADLAERPGYREQQAARELIKGILAPFSSDQ
jgi:hypothetical protein